MAGDWIKLEKATLDKPEVYAIAAKLKLDPDAVLGKLFRVWNWFDDHTQNGNAAGVTQILADRLAGVTGFGEAMEGVGWLVEAGGSLTLPNFERHNGETAKKRALGKNRVEKHRAEKRGGNASGNADGNAASVTDRVTREEKRREEVNPISTAKAVESPAEVLTLQPAGKIPYQEIVTAYNALMTNLAKVRDVTETRRATIRKVWQASKTRQSFEFWKQYFEECADDPFLNGSGPYKNGHENWRPDFDYLMRDKVVTRVYEKALHGAES